MDLENCIYGMGNPLLDISTNVDDAYLAKYDLKSNDAILADEKHMPIYDEISKKDDVEFIPGGATLNAVKVACWILGGNKSVSFAGCINKDTYGKKLEESCVELGVNPVFQYTATSEPTGTCAALLNGQDRSLVTSLGAANTFTADHLDNDNVWNCVKKSKICYVSGFFLTVCPPALMRVAKHTLTSGTILSMNLSAPFICEFFTPPLMEAMPYVDLLFGNESEAASLAKVQKWEHASVADIALKVSQLPVVEGKKGRLVVFTQGPDPVIVVQDGKITEYHVDPISADQIVDTNGAGDAFVGGFLSQYVQGHSIAECVRCGNYTARVVIQRSGCTFPDKHDFV